MDDLTLLTFGCIVSFLAVAGGIRGLLSFSAYGRWDANGCGASKCGTGPRGGTPIALVAGFALSVLGLFAGFAVTRPAAPALAPGPGFLEQSAAAPLTELGLDAEQAERIEALHSREAQRVDALQRAHADAEDSLRRAEFEIPFDAERVNELVARQAELLALLRGTESRVVAEIVALLHPEQRRRLAELRAGAAPGAPDVPQPPPAEPPFEDAEDARGVGISSGGSGGESSYTGPHPVHRSTPSGRQMEAGA